MILLALLLCVLKAHFSMAEVTALDEYEKAPDDSPWQIIADSLSYRDKDSTIIAKGDVVVSRGNQRLYADEALYNRTTGEIRLTGSIRLESGGDIFTGDEGVFNLQDQTGSITNGSIFITDNHYYISGDVIEKISEDSYLIKNCRVTTCNGETPSWSIAGAEVKVTIKGYGTIKHATFRVRRIPVFYWPYLIFPAKTDRQTGFLLPYLGHSSRNGAEIELPFFWAISDQTDATFYERFIEKRGFMQGLEFRYKGYNDSKGDFLFDIISDEITPKDMNDPDQVALSPVARTNQTRYWFRSKADQQLPVSIMSRLDLDFVSDQDYLKEFDEEIDGYGARPDLGGEFGRPLQDTHSATRRSALRLSHDSEAYSLQAIGEYNQILLDSSVNDETAQPVAGLDFSLLPRQLLDLSPYYAFDIDYDYIWRDQGQKGHRMSFKPGLSYPIWLGRYLEIEPSASYTGNIQWLDDNPEEDRQMQDAFQFDTRVSTLVEGYFDSSWMDITKIKHKFMPSLTYQYRFYNDEDRYQPWFEPIEKEGDFNRLTLSLDNYFDSRKENDKGDVSYAQLGTISLSQGLDIEETRREESPEREKEPFEPLVGSITFTPSSVVDLDAEAWWDHYINDISHSSLSLGVIVDRSGGNKDRYSVKYSYNKEGSRFLNYDIDFNISHRYSIGTYLKRDLGLNKTVESSYWIEYSSQCWGVRLTTKTQDSASSVKIIFSFLGLGDFGN